MDETSSRNRMKKTPGLIILGIVIAIVAGYLGYFLGAKNAPSTTQNPGYVGLEQDGLKLGPESIIKSQQATATGKVTRIDGRTITVQGDDNKMGSFRFASIVNIYPLSSSASSAAQPSQNPNDIKVGEMVILSMTLQGKEYVVNTLTYQPK